MAIKLADLLKEIQTNGIIDFTPSQGYVIFNCSDKCNIPFPGKWEEVDGGSFNYIVSKKHSKLAAAWAATHNIKMHSKVEDLEEGLLKNVSIGAALAVASLVGGAHKSNQDFKDALRKGATATVHLDKEIGIFNKHSNHSTDYVVKVDKSQKEPIKVDTSSNVVTINSPEVGGKLELVHKVNTAVRAIDPSLANGWEKFTHVKINK